MTKVVLNGEAKEIPDGQSISRLIRDLGLAEERIAVELNRDVVRRAEWDEKVLVDEDVIEVVHFVGGG